MEEAKALLGFAGWTATHVTNIVSDRVLRVLLKQRRANEFPLLVSPLPYPSPPLQPSTPSPTKCHEACDAVKLILLPHDVRDAPPSSRRHLCVPSQRKLELIREERSIISI